MHGIALALLSLLAAACSQTIEQQGAPDASDASGAGGHGGSSGMSAAGMSAAGSGSAMSAGGMTSAGGMMSDAGATGGDQACFDPAGVPACETRRLRRAVIEAASLGEGVRFTHANGQVLLATRETAAGSSQLVVRVGNSDHGEESVVLEIERDDEAASYVAVDVASAHLPASDANIVALLCDGDACALFGANAANDSALRPLPGGTVPSDVGARGFNEHIDERACVYGASGYACFDGSSWDQRQLEGVSLRYMSTQGRWTMAGDHGALYGLYAEDEGTLEPIATGLDDTFVWAAVDDRGCWTAITDEGRPVQGNCASASALPCDDGIELPRYLEHYSFHTSLVTRDGTLFRRSRHPQTGEHAWCSYASVGGEVIDVTSAPCGLEGNPLLLTASALYVVNYWGEIACPVG